MKLYRVYLTIVTSVLIVLSGCNRVDESESDFDNVVYVENVKNNNNTERVMLKANSTVLEKSLKAGMALPSANDIRVTFKPDPSLIGNYNKANDMESEPLPVANYSLSGLEATIPAGNVLSSDVTVTFTNLEDLPRNVNYVLPITLEGATGVSILNGAKTIYYVLRKGATITTAAHTGGNYFEFPTMASSDAMDGFTEITFEGLVKPRELNKNVNTFLGVEGYCLIRFGDANLPHNQAQFAGPSNYLSNLFLTVGKWQHVAMTFDVVNRTMIFYLDGVEVSRTASAPNFTGGVINLGSKLTDNKFYVGRSYDDTRDFIGDMCEVRVWKTIRTQEEIAANMYEVEPETEGLAAYWKMDEGSGKTIKDYSGNGLNGTAKNDLIWSSAELPAEN